MVSLYGGVGVVLLLVIFLTVMVRSRPLLPLVILQDIQRHPHTCHVSETFSKTVKDYFDLHTGGIPGRYEEDPHTGSLPP